MKKGLRSIIFDNNKLIGFSREIKDYMNLRDKMIRVRLLYETREYKDAINLIDSIHSQSLWDQLYLQGERNKCLYHLKENYKFPEKEFSRFLVVKQWETLLSTGNEFYDEQISEVYHVMKKDVESAYRRFYVYMTLAIVILGLIIIMP